MSSLDDKDISNILLFHEYFLWQFRNINSDDISGIFPEFPISIKLAAGFYISLN